MAEKNAVAEFLEKLVEAQGSHKVMRAACSRREGQCIWDILTALRGPDFDDSVSLKRATTGRIRDAVGFSGIQGGFCTTTWNSKLEKDEKAAVVKALTSPDYRHFLRHAQEAMKAIEAVLGKRIPTLDLLGGI